MAQDLFPLHPAAIVFPILAFPAWILDIPPMIWHFSQHNVAAGSLILWIILVNFFNSINSLLWPRDNLADWWDGQGWCDVHVRIQVATVVSLAACVTMIMRRLAKVMDTRNITIAPSRSSMAREKALEVVWCWGYPFVMIVIYYIVQPLRYFIFSISGCVAAYDSSWPSVVLSYMWGPITMCFATYFAGLLIYRLYRYRREFHRLIAARNTTKSRFMRLFVMSIIIIVIYLPYSFYILYALSTQLTDRYDWNIVHGPRFNTIIKVPTNGEVRFDKWGQVATGYLAFFVFGTGTDAYNTYKRMLCAIGLGKIFPKLYIMRGSGTSTPSSVTFVRTWRSTLSNKTKSLFMRHHSTTKTLSDRTRNSSVALTPITNQSEHLHPVTTNEPILHQHKHDTGPTRSTFSRLLTRHSRRQRPILPVYAGSNVDDTSQPDKSPADTVPPGIYTRAWATESANGEIASDNGVHVVQEVHQHQQSKKGKYNEKEVHDWA